MDLQDVLLPPRKFSTQIGQIGSKITNEILENSIVLLFVSDERNADGNADLKDFSTFREEFYALSSSDCTVPIVDLGDLVSGKTVEDTHYILQEVISLCLYKGALPIVIGGSSDLSSILYTALDFHHKKIQFSHIGSKIPISKSDNHDKTAFLSQIIQNPTFSLEKYCHLGYQKHLNDGDTVAILEEFGFPAIRLAEMMKEVSCAEPFFRHADLVTVNCDAIESGNEPFSLQPQVNGLNRREILSFMKEIGLSEDLKLVGIFNFNWSSNSRLNHQLLAQMLWYLVEGVNIIHSHPKEKNYETYIVLIENQEFTFKRETFRDYWYFAKNENPTEWLPCSKIDYLQAKNNIINSRFLRNE